MGGDVVEVPTTGERRPKRFWIQKISAYLLDDEPFQVSEIALGPYEHPYLESSLQQAADHRSPDKPGRSRYEDFHGDRI
jgi:hypothetical protein